MGRSSYIAASAVFAVLAGCASKPAPAPSPQAAPAPPSLPGPPPVMRAPPPSSDWRDFDLTPGIWFYDGASARFLTGDGAAFALRCDGSARRILLEREGASGQMTIRTSAADRSFPDVRAPLAAGDPFLDAIAFSRGRFVVETAGATMVIPAWPEAAKAVEDCRI